MLSIDQKTVLASDGTQVLVLEPCRRLDVTTTPRFRQHLKEIVQQGNHYLIVNLGQVDFMDSSGVTSLVVGMREVDQVKGLLRICNAQPEVKRIFEITMLDSIFSMFETEREAISTAWVSA
jgi:anti-anti-sigma factor